LEKAIERKDPSAIELLTNDLIRPAIQKNVMTADIARTCSNHVTTAMANAGDNESLKQALATLEGLLSSRITPEQKVDVRAVQRHTFLNGTTPNSAMHNGETHDLNGKYDKLASTPVSTP
jgi:hypothetical protein